MRRAAFVAVALCAAHMAGAQPAVPVDDVERGAASVQGADPHEFVDMGGVTYYAASDVEHGFELWCSDGSAAGTRLVADIQPGPVGALPRHLVVVGDALFFTASDGTSGFGLWTSDGTAAGTRLLRAAGPSAQDPFEVMLFPGQLAAFGATVLFTARDHTGTPALWSSDGTPEGTRRIAPLDGHRLSDVRLPLAVVGNAAYFMTRAGGQRVLWRTDGTGSGTAQVWSGATGDGPDLYAAFGGLLVFRGTGGAPWRTDGTPQGTLLLANPSYGAAWFTQVGTTLYFAAGGHAYQPYQELWRTDGTPAGTALVASFSNRTLSQLTSAGGRVFFVVGDFLFTARGDIAVSDGTSAGTQVVLPNVAIPYIAGAGDHLTFAAAGAGVLGINDGTPGGTLILRDDLALPFGGGLPGLAFAPLAPTPALTCAASGCFFRARRATDRRPPEGQRAHELWRSDGTTAGTQSVLSRAGRSRGSWPEQFVNLGAATYFATSLFPEPAPGWGGVLRLQRPDPTTGGTQTVTSWTYGDGACLGLIGAMRELCRLVLLTPVGNRLFFVRGDGVLTPGELWTSDGTAAGTSRLGGDTLTVAPRHGAGVVGGRFVFASSDQLWSSDGTQAGTQPIGAPVGGLGFDDLLFTPVGGLLYFATPDALYKTDGTPGSVQLVSAVPAGELTDVAGTLYFASGGELWTSDGTPGGTRRVAAVQHATRLTTAGQQLYFTSWDSAHGTELWVSDGTEAGTRLVVDLRGGVDSSDPDALTSTDVRLFFTADNGLSGRELWVTDGTREGTQLVADVRPGAVSGLGVGPILVAGAGRVYFPAFTPATGVELWSSDGTTTGTALVQDIAPGAAGSNPRELAVVGGWLCFSADDGVHGQEPWRLPLARFAPRLAKRFSARA